MTKGTKNDQSWFLEAPLVCKADGELENKPQNG